MTTGDPARAAQGGLDAYAALAAHQLGEAVALVRGAASVLDGQAQRLGPGTEDAMRAMAAGTERAQRFVDDLLDLVRVAGDPEPLTPRSADLVAAYAAAQVALDPTLRRGGVRISARDLDVVPAPLERGDAERLFAHLLRNALAAGARRIHAVAERDGDELVLEVADDGEPPREGGDPFAPFARPRGRGPLVGAGVSLAVCRGLVERRSGTIDLATVDATVVVVVRLPLSS